MDKKIIKYVLILTGLIILIVIFLWVQSLLTGGKTYSYSEIESKMISAAKKYVNDKGEEILPEVAGEYFSLESSVLINGGYLDDLSSYTKDGIACSGTVDIYNSGNENYDYVPFLNCGSSYETKKLSTSVIGENGSNIVIEGSGLYQRLDGKFVTSFEELYGTGSENIEYVFRGDIVNNYLKIDDNIWRIVSIDSEGNLLVILDSHSQKAYSWDDRYNEDENKYQGVNTYELNGLQSSVYKTVQDFYNGDIPLMNRVEFSPKIRIITTPMDLCVGKRSNDESDTSGVIECKEVLNDQLIGLLPVYYFMSASLDENCTSTTSKSCGNYNYLSSFNNYWWLLTGNSENTNEAFAVSQKYIKSNLCNYKADIRPIIKIGARANYLAGDGTEENPYVIASYGE